MCLYQANMEPNLQRRGDQSVLQRPDFSIQDPILCDVCRQLSTDSLWKGPEEQIEGGIGEETRSLMQCTFLFLDLSFDQYSHLELINFLECTVKLCYVQYMKHK